MIVGEKKPSLDELAHYGVLGMKWGHRRAANAAQIRAARRRVGDQNAQLDAQRGETKAAKGTRKYGVEKRRLDTMKMSFLKNPDRVIAARMTRGEKIAAVMFTGVATPLTAGSVAAIAATSARSRRIEYKQQTRQYDKKK